MREAEVQAGSREYGSSRGDGKEHRVEGER